MATNQVKDPVLTALNNQYNAVLVTGSNLFDLQVELERMPEDIFLPTSVCGRKIIWARVQCVALQP